MSPLLVELQVGEARYRADLGAGVDLADPVRFRSADETAHPRDDQGDVEATSAFSLPGPTSAPVRAGSFVGATAEGGSVNCRSLTLVPHGCGTHTESVGHIVDDEAPVTAAAPAGLLPAVLLTVAPVSFAKSAEPYGGQSAPDDRVLTAAALDEARGRVEEAGAVPSSFFAAVIVRVLKARPPGGRWSGSNPPYLTDEAARRLRAWGTEHLLLEVPSADREDDGGKTSAHHLFFGVAGRRLLGPPPRRTITEMVVVPEALDDGLYLLDLQIAPLVTDAAPSRPVVFALRPA